MRALVSSWLLACSLTAATSQPRLADRAESDLVSAIRKEKDANHRLELLNTWAKRYPRSAFRQERYRQILTTLQALKKGEAMMPVARRMAADDPSGYGTYWIAVLTVSLGDVSTPALQAGQRASTALLRNATRTFVPARCPVAVPLAAWIHERDREIAVAHRTLGWVALQRQLVYEAEREFRTVLKMQPDDAEVSFWLGKSLLGEKRPEVEAEALYSFARSLAVTGDGALTPPARTLVQRYFEQAYASRFGGKDGMQALLGEAARSPFPPQGSDKKPASAAPSGSQN